MRFWSLRVMVEELRLCFVLSLKLEHRLIFGDT